MLGIIQECFVDDSKFSWYKPSKSGVLLCEINSHKNNFHQINFYQINFPCIEIDQLNVFLLITNIENTDFHIHVTETRYES